MIQHEVVDSNDESSYTKQDRKDILCGAKILEKKFRIKAVDDLIMVIRDKNGKILIALMDRLDKMYWLKDTIIINKFLYLEDILKMEDK